MNAPSASIKLAPLVQQFFTERLMPQSNVSPRTVAAYRDTFRLLLLGWFEQKFHKRPDQLALTDLDATRIAAGSHPRNAPACGRRGSSIRPMAGCRR
jgi:hypothetical protein